MSIIERFQLNPSHAVHCAQCFEATSSLFFWIWDPMENPNYPYSPDDSPIKNCAHLLLAPTSRQRRESLEVRCSIIKERTVLSVDKCLLSQHGEERCEALLFDNYQPTPELIWIELKMNAKRVNPNMTTLEERVIGKAINQVLSTMQVFADKGIVLSAHKNKAHIAVPKELMGLYVKSQEIKKRIVSLRKIVKIFAGNILEL